MEIIWDLSEESTTEGQTTVANILHELRIALAENVAGEAQGLQAAIELIESNF